MDYGGNHPGGSWNRHADKIFSPWPAGIGRYRVGVDVKSRQAPGPAKQKEKADERAPLDYVLPPHRIHGHGKILEAPGEGQEARSDAKGDHVGQRIELLAEVAGGFGHARNAPIQSVKRDGEADGQGGIVEMP